MENIYKTHRLQAQALAKNITLIRRQYRSISSLLSDHPSTDLLINCTGIGSLHLFDIKDTNLYPTRGQTLLVAEPKTPIQRMYEYERHYKYDGSFESCIVEYNPVGQDFADDLRTGTSAHPNASIQQLHTCFRVR
jgi:hypothetical protein